MSLIVHDKMTAAEIKQANALINRLSRGLLMSTTYLTMMEEYGALASLGEYIDPRDLRLCETNKITGE